MLLPDHYYILITQLTHTMIITSLLHGYHMINTSSPSCFRLRLFQSFESFRVLVCAGDGSIGWVLSEIDRLGLHKQVSCTVGPFCDKPL